MSGIVRLDKRERLDYDNKPIKRPDFDYDQDWKLLTGYKCNTSIPTDKTLPRITGCCEIPGTDNFLLCDNKNGNVKKVDNVKKVRVDVPVAGDPFDIDAFGKYAVVSIPKKMLLQFLDVSPGLRLKQQSDIKLGYEGYGVCVRRKNIYVSCPEAGIQVVSLCDGKILRLIPCPGSSPTHIEVSSDNTTIFCSSPERDERPAFVLCLTTQGDALYKFTHASLHKPGSLIADDMGNILVTEKGSRNVYLVKPKGDIVCRRHLSPELKMTLGATAMCYNKQKNVLLVAVECENKETYELLFYEQTESESWIWYKCSIL